LFEFFESILRVLDRHDNHVLLVAIFAITTLTLIALRMIAHIHMKAALKLFYVDTKREIRTREDVMRLKYRLLRKAVADYKQVAERAVTNIPTLRIVERVISNMSLLGWKYTGLLPLIEALESAILWIGLIFAIVFITYAHVYGITAVALYLFLRLVSAFFNVREAKSQLIDEMVIFIDREIGRFYASDSGGAILRLKNDLSEVVGKQTTAFKTTMETIAGTMQNSNKEVSDSMIAAANSIGTVIAQAIDEKLLNMNINMEKITSNWETALEKAAETQGKMNETAERISMSGARLQNAAELLATHMQGHSNSLSEQLVSLVAAADAVKDSVRELSAGQAALTRHSEYIESNQAAFETALSAYEKSLQDLAHSLGDGIGTFVNHHAREASDAINKTMDANIAKILNLVGD